MNKSECLKVKEKFSFPNTMGALKKNACELFNCLIRHIFVFQLKKILAEPSKVLKDVFYAIDGIRVSVIYLF